MSRLTIVEEFQRRLDCGNLSSALLLLEKRLTRLRQLEAKKETLTRDLLGLDLTVAASDVNTQLTSNITVIKADLAVMIPKLVPYV